MIEPVPRLAELEAVIERGLPTFMEVGAALAEISKRRLYKQDFTSFEAYCRQRWGFTRQHAYRLIDASKLSPAGDSSSEWQARARIRELRAQGLSRREIGAEVGVPDGVVQYAIRDLPVPDGLHRGRTREDLTPRTTPLFARREWSALIGLIESVDRFAEEFSDIEAMAKGVPTRRRGSTATRLRKAGTYLARIAYTLEATEGDSDDNA